MQKQAKTDATENKTFDFIDNHFSFRAGNSTSPTEQYDTKIVYFFKRIEYSPILVSQFSHVLKDEIRNDRFPRKLFIPSPVSIGYLTHKTQPLKFASSI